MCIIDWLNSNNGFTTFLLTFALVIITFYYARQTKKQANDAHKMLDESSKQLNKAALNYAYLINGDLATHQLIFVKFLYYKKIKKSKVLGLGALLSKDFDNLNSKTWEAIKTEVPKYYSNNLMQDLVGYYFGIENLLYGTMTEEQKIEMIMGQLISMKSCIEIIESEFKINLRKIEVFEFDGLKYEIDYKNGELITSNN